MSTLGENYQTLLKNIDHIATKCGRDPKGIKLIAVTKTHPVEEILSLYEAGCRDMGESRIQDALEKIDETPKDLNWHFIGTLQKNKVRKVVGRFALIHSVDSPDLATKISVCSEEMKVVTKILLQVNTSGELSKHGLDPDMWRQEYQKVLNLQNISIDGLMTMAPLTEDEDIIRITFRRLKEFREELAGIGVGMENAPMSHLSMGMSHDYPIAIEEGATLLRIGSALFA